MDRKAEFLMGAVNIGRWSISERESQSGITVNDAAGRSVARVPRRDDDLDVARLIAAAPDLLINCEQLCQLIESIGHDCTPAREAIAKARGRE